MAKYKPEDLRRLERITMKKSFDEMERAWESQQDMLLNASMEAQDMEDEEGARNNEEDFNIPDDEPYDSSEECNAWMDFIA